MTYRRSIQEIPVEALELEEAEMEGVEIMYMVTPIEVVGERGKVTGLRLVKNELGAPDKQGRRRPEPIPGSEFVVDCDMILVAIGQKQDSRFLGEHLASRDKRGVPFLDQNLRTELPNVWASGDYVVNPTNFISSIGEGKRVVEHIDRQMRGTAPASRDMELTRTPTEFLATPNPLVAEGIAEWSLTSMSRRLIEVRLHSAMPSATSGFGVARNSVGVRVSSMSREAGAVPRIWRSMCSTTRLPSPIEEMKLVGLTT
jgi:hypothetical protein